MPVTGFLQKIKILKQEEVKDISKRIPFHEIREKAEMAKESASFKKALEQSCPNNPGIIAEIKKASPSKGDIKLKLDPKIYAQIYEKAGACAISVLTEKFYFKGSADDLAIVCNSVSIPVLRKDFIISSYQIFEAKALGASSILLINKLLEQKQLKDYIALARSINMEPLVEIHSEKEFDTALTAGAYLLGVNNRNLETLKTDLEVSKRIGTLFTNNVTGDMNNNIIGIEASGISSKNDIIKGIQSGYFNFLVGESIVRAANCELFIKELKS